MEVPGSIPGARFEPKGTVVTDPYIPSDAANEAGDYFNALPTDERLKLAPLLEHYRQMGLAEAYEEMRRLAQRTRNRIDAIRAA